MANGNDAYFNVLKDADYDGINKSLKSDDNTNKVSDENWKKLNTSLKYRKSAYYKDEVLLDTEKNINRLTNDNSKNFSTLLKDPGYYKLIMKGDGISRDADTSSSNYLFKVLEGSWYKKGNFYHLSNYIPTTETIVTDLSSSGQFSHLFLNYSTYEFYLFKFNGTDAYLFYYGNFEMDNYAIYFHKELYAELEDASIEDQTSTTITIGTDENQKSYEIGSTFLTYVKSIDNDATESKFFDYCIFDDYDDSRYHKIVMYNMRTEFYVGFDTSAGHEVTLTNPNISAEYRSVIFNIADKQDIEVDSESKDKTVILFDNKTPVKASGGSNLGKKLNYLPSTTKTAEKTHLIDDYFNNIVADDKYRLGGPNSEGINVNIYDKLIQNKKETGGIYLQFLGNSNIVKYSINSNNCEFLFTDLNSNSDSNYLLNGTITLGSTLEFRIIMSSDGYGSLDFGNSKLGTGETYTFKACCLDDKLTGFSIERVYYHTYDVKIPVVKEILEDDGSLIINIEAQQKNSYLVDFNEQGKVIKTLNVKSKSLNYDVSLTRKETTDSSGNTIVSFDKKEFNTAVGISDIYSISVYFQGTNEIDKRENFLYNELTDTIADYKIYDVSNCGKIYENDGYDTALNNDIFIVSNDDFAVNYVDVTISLANQVPLPQINDTVTGSSSDDSYLDNGGAGTGKCTQVFYYVDSNKRLKEYVFGSKIKALENEYIYICVLYNTTRISIDEENSYLSKNYEIMAMDGSSVFAPHAVSTPAQSFVNGLFTTEGLNTSCKLLGTTAFKKYLCKYQGKDSGYAYVTNDNGETLIGLEITKRVKALLDDYDYDVLAPQACSYAKSTVENAAIESASTAKNTYIEKQATAEALEEVNSDVLSDYINYIMMTSYTESNGTIIPSICDEIETVNKNYNIYKDMKKSSLKDGTFYTEIKNITDSYLKSVSEESIDDKTNEKSIAYYRKGPLDDSDGFEDYKVGEINFIYDDYFSGYTMPTMKDCGIDFSSSGKNCLNSINSYVSDVTSLLEKIGNYYYSLNDTIKLKTAQLSALNTISNESNSEEVKKTTYNYTLTALDTKLSENKDVTEKSKYNADKEAEQIRKDVSEKLSQEKAEKIYDYEINNTLEELKGIEDYDYTPQFSIKDYINDQLFEKKLLAIEKAIIKTISDEAALKASIDADKEASDKASIISTDDAVIKNSENLLFNQKAKFIYNNEYNKYLGGNYTETYRLGKAAAAENEFRSSTTVESFYSDAVKEVYNESYNYYYKDYYDSLYNEYYKELYTNAIEDDSEYVKKVLSSSEISNYIDSILDVMSNSDEIKLKASIDAKSSLARSLLTTLKKIIDEINRLNLNKSLYKKLANESSYSADGNLTKLSLEVLPDSSKLLTTETYLFNKAAQKVYDDEYSSTQSVEKAETAKNAYIKSTDVSSFKSDANTLLTESEYLDKYSKSINDESNICYNNLFVKDSSLKLPYADSRNPQDVYNDAIKNLSSSSSIKSNAELKALETVGRQELLDSITDGLKENLLATLNSSISLDADKYAINKINDESNEYALQKAEDYAIEKSQSESLDSSEIQSTATYLFNEGIIEAYNEKYASLNELVSEEYRVEEASLAKEKFLKYNTVESFYSKAEEFIRKSLYEKYYKEGFEKYFEEKYNEFFISEYPELYFNYYDSNKKTLDSDAFDDILQNYIDSNESKFIEKIISSKKYDTSKYGELYTSTYNKYYSYYSSEYLSDYAKEKLLAGIKNLIASTSTDSLLLLQNYYSLFDEYYGKNLVSCDGDVYDSLNKDYSALGKFINSEEEEEYNTIYNSKVCSDLYESTYSIVYA